jgi:hypothetical protein
VTDKPKVIAFKKPEDEGVDAILAEFLVEMNKFETEMGQKFHHIVLAASTDEGVTISRYYGGLPHCSFLVTTMEHHIMGDKIEDLVE